MSVDGIKLWLLICKVNDQRCQYPEMTTSQVVTTYVSDCQQLLSPIQGYVHPDDYTQPTYNDTFHSFTKTIS